MKNNTSTVKLQGNKVPRELQNVFVNFAIIGVKITVESLGREARQITP